MVGVALTVGGWFASVLISQVIDRLKSYLEGNYDLGADVNDSLATLEVALPRIEAAINAAEARPIRDLDLVAWLRRLKDAAYRADDMLDDLESRFLCDRLKNENKVRAFKSSKMETFKRTILTDDVLKNLKNLAQHLKEIYDDTYRRLPELTNYIRDIRSAPRKYSSDPSQVIGRNKETDYIVSKLLSYREEAGTSSAPSFVVLPIIGIGGIGKTTLARDIFKKSQNNDFPLRVWLDLSSNFDINKIANQLLSSLSKNKSLSSLSKNKSLMSEKVDDHCYVDTSLEGMLVTLNEMTAKRRFLIVLDDVWKVDKRDWKTLQKSLECGARGSTVLITTQYQKVAKITQTVDPVKLDVLGKDDYQKLIEQSAFDGQILEEHKRKELQQIGWKISEILQGLPRAGNALGKLLSDKLESNHWNNISNSEWWEHDAVLEDVLPSLALNYQNLDASQKLCFAYCSIFPRGYIFLEDRLVHMWMAQGFIQPKTRGRMTIEDMGSQVFAELVDRNFFQKKSENEYVMHDIIRELAVYLSLDECFVISDETEEIPQRVRHLTVKTNKLDAFSNLSWVKNLRTILFFGKYETEEFYSVLKNILTYSKSLRVLDISNSQTEISKVPSAIGYLSHLRYLDISSTKICLLPKLFCKLSHLQVLMLPQCPFDELPEGMNKLINLRHLCAEPRTVSLISGIGKLTCLQELKEFHVKKKKGHRIEELRKLKELRGQLLIQNLENVDSKEEARKAKLTEKKHLNALHLYFEIKDELGTGSSFILTRIYKGFSKNKSTPNLEGLLDGLEPFCEIKELGIKGYDSTTFPRWLVNMEHFTSLKSIYLSSCNKFTSLPTLGQLPSLMILHIEALPELRKIGVEVYGGNGYEAFPSLEDLKLQNLEEFEEWSEVQDRQLFPCLKILHIENCLKLTTLALLTLNSPIKELKINSCGDLGSALPECLRRFTLLTTLKISHYPHVTSLSLSNLVALQNLCLSNCQELSLQGDLQSLRNLKQPEITGCPKLNSSN